MSSRAWRLASLAAVALTAACGETLGPEDDALAAARSLWARRAPEAYTFRVQRSCFCGTEFLRAVQVDVVDGEVVFASFADDQEPIDTPLDEVPDIDDLFAEVEDAIHREADRLLAEYDEAYGFPSSVSIDFDFRITDEEMAFMVSHFDVLSQPAN